MNSLVLSDFGSRLSVSHFRLVVNGEEYEPRSFPYDAVFCTTHAGIISFEAVRWLSNHKVPLFFIDWHGELQSSVIHRRPPRGGLRLAQYAAACDPQRTEEIASWIVREKNRRMGLEGDLPEWQAARAYWKTVGEKFRALGYEWEGRRNKGDILNWKATNPANSLLNFGNSVMEAIVRKEVNAVGLDPAIGFLHHSREWNDPLVFDLLELWRHKVSLAVLSVLGSKPRVTERDFQRNSDDYSLRLRPELARRLIEEIHRELDLGEMQHTIGDFAKMVAGQPRSGMRRQSARLETALSPSLRP